MAPHSITEQSPLAAIAAVNIAPCCIGGGVFQCQGQAGILNKEAVPDTGCMELAACCAGRQPHKEAQCGGEGVATTEGALREVVVGTGTELTPSGQELNSGR